jgi:hypothetical protein
MDMSTRSMLRRAVTCDSCPLDAPIDVPQTELESNPSLLLSSLPLLLLLEGELHCKTESRHWTRPEVMEDLGRM